MNVFVYGTLMKPYGNHALIEDEKFLGNAVLEGYGLYNVSPFFPGIIEQEGAAVKGEVYDINEATLKKLDRLEGEGSLYIRKNVQVILESKEVISAYVYIWNKAIDPQSYIPFEKSPWKPFRKKH